MVAHVEEPVSSSRGNTFLAAAAERFCPECGQPLSLPRPTVPGLPIGRCRRSWALIAVGLLLVACFGLQAAIASQAMADRADVLWRTAGIEAGEPVIARPLDPDRSVVVEQDQTLWLLNRYTVARQQRDRDLALVGFGLLTVLIGLGSSARERALRLIANLVR